MTFGKIDQAGEMHADIGPQERIAYHGDLQVLMDDALLAYELGTAESFVPKQNGYEDFNVELATSQKPVFLKCFADWRTTEECERYLEMVEAAYADGVRTPKIYRNKRDAAVTSVMTGGVPTRLCIMEYLDGGNIWESGKPLTREEQAEVVKQAAMINKSSYRPAYVHDSWAIPNLADNYLKNKGSIPAADRELIGPLLDQLGKADIQKLPYAFVHGDLRSTNVMRHHDKKVYAIDFSVANFYPRIVEMAVLCSDILFDASKPDAFAQTFDWAIAEYQKAGIKLTDQERQLLPLFVKLAHAANIIGSSSVDATNYISHAENNHWMRLGQQGLHYLAQHWRA